MLPSFRDLISVCFPLLFLFSSCFHSAESIKKIVDKSSIKFIHAVKLDTKTGKTEDRVLVRSAGSFSQACRATITLPRRLSEEGWGGST